MKTLEKELETAVRLAKQAGELQLSRLAGLKRVEIKADRSPVSEVDEACEKILRGGLEAAFPDDGFLGEETGERVGRSGRTWIVDPIDGTRPYLHGIPTFSVLVSLEDGGDPVLGLILLPAMDELHTATKGGGAFRNGAPVRVSKTGSLADAMGAQFGYFHQPNSPEGLAIKALGSRADYLYGFMDAWSYGAIASGRLDFSVNLLDKPWDCSAAACLIREAGGRFSDLSGRETTRSGNMLFSNGALHDELLSFFAPTK
ncbi:MAG: inositol monophosphatase [Spirochaetes bacterium]|nr:inositol monophosphatase [Spirochaetota bacterium]